MAKKLATSNLPFQGFEGIIRTQNKNNLENPLFVLLLTLFMDLDIFWKSKLMTVAQCCKRMLLAKKSFEFHASVQKCHFGNFSLLAKWHFWTFTWNSKIFFAKALFWSIMKLTLIKSFQKMSQGPPNWWLRSAKVQKEDFLKKPSRDLKNYFCCWFIWIPRTPGRVNYKWLFFFAI